MSKEKEQKTVSENLPAQKKKLSGSVWALSFVSLFTDTSSEMIMPNLGKFISTYLGAGPVVLGIIEGIAETTAALLRIFSGVWADRAQKRKPIVVVGYTFSNFFRPLIGLATTWPFVLFCRFADRVGKGLRSSPRDAIIADVTDPSMRGQAFGLNRSLDHAGAILGPLLAAGLIALGFQLGTVFLLSAIPGAIAVLILIFGVKEEKREIQRESDTKGRNKLTRFANSLVSDFRKISGNFKVFLVSLLFFTLGNSTDLFLLARLNELGVDKVWNGVIWASFHVVKMVTTYIGGKVSDKIGRKPMIFSGWVVYAAIYLLFALVQSPSLLVAIFFVYGIYYGFTEPAEKALVADLVPQNLRGTAFGYYNGVIGIAALPASILFGYLTQTFSPFVAFTVGACFAGAASFVLLFVRVHKTS